MYKLICLLFFLPVIHFETHAASHHPQEFLYKIQGAPDEGKQIVAHFCTNCHAVKPLIPLGAPKTGKCADWQPRLKKGLKNLFHNTSVGYNNMPPRGGCFECSDKQLYLAIMALLPKSKKCKSSHQ